MKIIAVNPSFAPITLWAWGEVCVGPDFNRVVAKLSKESDFDYLRDLNLSTFRNYIEKATPPEVNSSGGKG